MLSFRRSKLTKTIYILQRYGAKSATTTNFVVCITKIRLCVSMYTCVFVYVCTPVCVWCTRQYSNQLPCYGTPRSMIRKIRKQVKARSRRYDRETVRIAVNFVPDRLNCTSTSEVSGQLFINKTNLPRRCFVIKTDRHGEHLPRLTSNKLIYGKLGG